MRQIALFRRFVLLGVVVILCPAQALAWDSTYTEEEEYEYFEQGEREEYGEAEKEYALFEALEEAEDILMEDEGEYPEDREVRKRKKFKEITVTAERAGTEAYYIPGEGFKLTEELGVGVKMEIFEEPRSTEDCISWAVGENPWSFSKIQLRDKLNPTFTRVYGLELIYRHEDYPRVKYIYEYREEPKEDYPTNKDIHEFNFLQTFSIFEHEDILTLNPIFKKHYYKNPNPWWGPEERNEYLLNYTIELNDSLQVFGQLNWQRGKKSNTPGLTVLEEQYNRIELRKTFPDSKLRITPGYKYSRVDERPSDKVTLKYEPYLEVGKDFDKLGISTRLEYVFSEKTEEARVDPEVLNCNNKFSYKIYKDFSLSGYLNYSRDLTELEHYHKVDFITELEYFKWGFLRWNFGYKRTQYTRMHVGFDSFYFKVYFFI